MIKFTAQNFGCLKDFSIELQPLHALIGPNDSGKSTVLRALECLSSQGNQGNWQHYANRGKALLSVSVNGVGHSLVTKPSLAILDERGKVTTAANIRESGKLGAPLLLRPDPDCMRRPVSLIEQNHPMRFSDDRGTGLAALYDALVNRDVTSFLKISTEVCRLFPGVESLQLQNPNNSQKVLAVKVVGVGSVAADFVSEGLLYYLAFAILPYLSDKHILLIEEPENGLHPARIREVMKVLRKVSETSQVVIATHSPLVINEMKPEEVSIITRDPATGTKATPMLETKNFEQRSKVYALGELWLSYADGEMEKELVPEGSQT